MADCDQASVAESYFEEIIMSDDEYEDEIIMTEDEKLVCFDDGAFTVQEFERYPQEWRQQLWYTAKEYNAINNRDALLLKLKEADAMYESNDQSFRGLEIKTRKNHAAHVRAKTLLAVIGEQQSQRAFGKSDPEVIALKYSAETVMCVKYARLLALQDARDALAAHEEEAEAAYAESVAPQASSDSIPQQETADEDIASSCDTEPTTETCESSPLPCETPEEETPEVEIPEEENNQEEKAPEEYEQVIKEEPKKTSRPRFVRRLSATLVPRMLRAGSSKTLKDEPDNTSATESEDFEDGLTEVAPVVERPKMKRRGSLFGKKFFTLKV